MLVGAVAGAAAVFFSDKKNREKASKAVTKSKVQLKKLSTEVKKNPEAFAKKMANKASAQIKKLNRKIVAKTTKKV